MNYSTMETGTGCAREPLPVENLTDMLQETAAMAVNVRIGAASIRARLFGEEPVHCSAEAPREKVSCFRDELAETRRQLLVASETLAEITALLGMK